MFPREHTPMSMKLMEANASEADAEIVQLPKDLVHIKTLSQKIFSSEAYQMTSSQEF